MNPLFLLLLTAGSFLWLAFPSIQQHLFNQKTFQEISIDAQHLLHTPDAAAYQKDSIYSYNPSLELWYSLNGGTDFQKAENGVLSLKNLHNTPNIYQSTSIRWRHPKGDFPRALSLVIKLKDPAHQTVTKPLVIQYPPERPTWPTLLINIPHNDLFDWYQGMMIYGVTANQDEGFQKDWWFRSANFASRGQAWKRPAYCTFYDRELPPESYHTVMAISGNATRYFPQKSMKFYLTDEVGRSDAQHVPFWEDGNKKARSFVLRNSGNDNMRTMFADQLVHSLAAESHVLVQKGQPVHGYINGNFWGIYNLRERVDDYFVAKREDVKRKEVTLLVCENFGDRVLMKDGSAAVKADFETMIDSIQQDGWEVDELYDYLRKDLSIKSFIDYVLFESFFANNDWPHNNVTFYKADDKDWKWVLNDLDYSMAYPGVDNVNRNQFEFIQNSHSIVGFLFNALLQHEEFRKKLKKRGETLLATNLSNKRIQQVYDDLYQRYEPEMERQIRRWRFIQSMDTWREDCQANVNFLLQRRKIFQEHLNQL